MSAGLAGVEPITLERLQTEWPQLHHELMAIGLVGIEFVGSTGKKQLMGDVDVACSFAGTIGDAFKAIAQRFGFHNVCRAGGNVVSVRYDAGASPFQVDVMLGDVRYLRWSRFGSSQEEGHPDFSPVKSSGRNFLLNVVARFVSEAKWPPLSPLNRTRYCIDFDRGLYEANQTKRRKNGGVLKDWRSDSSFFVTSDPDAIVHRLFDNTIAASDTLTFEGVVSSLLRSRRNELAPRVLRATAIELRDLVEGRAPHLLGGEPQQVLAYIDRLVQKVEDVEQFPSTVPSAHGTLQSDADVSHFDQSP